MACHLCSLSTLIVFYVVYKILDWLVRIPKLGNLNRRYILVTGCDTGFGNAAAKKLDGMGCHVFAACYTEKGEDELKKSCSDRLKTLHLDVSNHDSVLKAYDYVKDNIPEGMGLWGVLNNAGVGGIGGQIDWLQVEDYKKMMAVNLYGLVDVSITFLPLVRTARGRFINTASIFGRVPIQGNAPYSASKYGVEAFSDSLRRDIHQFGVSVHIIEPGFHNTNMVNTQTITDGFQACWDRQPQHVKDTYGEKFVVESKKAFADNFFKSGVVTEGVSDVVGAYVHALLGVYPRGRYVVGKDAKFLFVPLLWMPEFLSDWLIRVLRKQNGFPNAATAVK